jgi:hypothetical protein
VLVFEVELRSRIVASKNHIVISNKSANLIALVI